MVTDSQGFVPTNGKYPGEQISSKYEPWIKKFDYYAASYIGIETLIVVCIVQGYSSAVS